MFLEQLIGMLKCQLQHMKQNKRQYPKSYRTALKKAIRELEKVM